MGNFYKVFFTISFDYAEKKNKIITKYFKSDIDLKSNDFQEGIDDRNIYKLWKQHALNKPLKDLNPVNNFNDKQASNRKVVTHRIVNLRTLTEIFID